MLPADGQAGLGVGVDDDRRLPLQPVEQVGAHELAPPAAQQRKVRLARAVADEPPRERLDARAEVEVLAARLALAERRLTRARELEARQSLAVEILDEREAERTVLIGQIKVAEARIARDEVAASRCVITSPFRALLRERLAPLGGYVGVGDPVAAVAALTSTTTRAARTPLPTVVRSSAPVGTPP